MSTSLHHQLVIEVGKDLFAFGLKDLPTDKFTRFQSCNIDSLAPLDAQLDQIFSENNWLLATYRDILVIHNNDLNTFVPQILFDETLMGNYLQYTVKIYSTDFFDFDECHDMRNVYVPYVNFNNYLIDKLGTFSYRHISTVFLDYILVIHNNDFNTFVPQILFDETLMGNYLQYTVKIYSTDFFDFDECHDMRNVYVPYVNFNNYLIDKLGTFSYRHISTVFLDYVLDNQTDIKDGVFVCINQKSLLICVVQNGKFKLYNRFSVQSKEDF